MQYTTFGIRRIESGELFYQDFKDTFVCNTQHWSEWEEYSYGCFIRISKILLYAIHNRCHLGVCTGVVVLSGFQRYFCMQYTTLRQQCTGIGRLFYQDFKDTFVCNTQHCLGISPYKLSCFIRISKILLYAIHNYFAMVVFRNRVVLSGFQRYFCMQYTTTQERFINDVPLFYQDFKDTFVCNTQLRSFHLIRLQGCFIRISMNNLLQKYRKNRKYANL